MVFRTSIFSIALLIIVLMGRNTSAQLPILDKISKPIAAGDSASAGEISIDNLNTEIEITDNLILKSDISDFEARKQQELMQNVDSFNVYIAQQGKEFKRIKQEEFSHFLLRNVRISWLGYYKTLRDYQNDLQKIIREVQEKQTRYINNKQRWEKSLPNLNKNLTEQIRSHINTNSEKINQIIKEYDLIIKQLITSENKIVQDIIFADGILNQIEVINDKRRSELFTQNSGNIFAVNYINSYSGSFFDRLKLVFTDNTKTLRYFYSGLKSNIVLGLFLVLALILYFFFIRKKYIGLNYNTGNEGFEKINQIIIQKPALTAIFVIIILWQFLIPYSPLIINLSLQLIAIVLLAMIFSPDLDPFLKRIMVGVIVLLALSNFEIFAWYFGNYSRIYLAIESFAGVYLTYKYILPRFKIRKFGSQNKKLIIYAQLIIFLVFFLYTVALLLNIAGYVNLTLYCLRIGVYVGVISVFVIGFLRINRSIIRASIDVLNIYYPEIVRQYGPVIFSKLNYYLRVVMVLFGLTGILKVAEIYEIVSQQIISVFTNKINIGSLSFTFGSIILFIAILYFTYLIAKFTKQIIEREVLSKHEMKRGMAASISLTVRIFVVFFGALLALSVTGMDFSKIGIIAGALSVGIGFGLQNIVSNFISGLILIYEKPVQEGDTVEVDTLLGRVSNIGIRSSTITTYDGAEVVVPNSNLISNQLINWTLSDNKKRIEVKVGVSYESDPHLVLELLLNAALSHESVLRFPEPRPLFVGFGDNSLNFRLLFWVRFEEGLATQSDVVLKIYDILKENNIEIPFPQLDLHVKNAKREFLNEGDTT